jgi:hypothetical protein
VRIGLTDPESGLTEVSQARAELLHRLVRVGRPGELSLTDR